MLKFFKRAILMLLIILFSVANEPVFAEENSLEKGIYAAYTISEGQNTKLIIGRLNFNNETIDEISSFKIDEIHWDLVDNKGIYLGGQISHDFKKILYLGPTYNENINFNARDYYILDNKGNKKSILGDIVVPLIPHKQDQFGKKVDVYYNFSATLGRNHLLVEANSEDKHYRFIMPLDKLDINNVDVIDITDRKDRLDFFNNNYETYSQDIKQILPYFKAGLSGVSPKEEYIDKNGSLMKSDFINSTINGLSIDPTNPYDPNNPLKDFRELIAEKFIELDSKIQTPIIFDSKGDNVLVMIQDKDYYEFYQKSTVGGSFELLGKIPYSEDYLAFEMIKYID